MKKLSCGLVTLCFVSCGSSAVASSATELNMTGLITPQACALTLPGNGTIDYGKIAARDLNQNEFTLLPAQQLELSVTCSGPMLFALVGIDNKAQSSLAPDVLYGLGHNIHAPTERLGSVALSYRDPLGDSIPMLSLASNDNGASWFVEPNAYPKKLMGFARPGVLRPEPVTRLITTLRIDSAINLAKYLTLDEEVPMDGAITLDLRYL